MKVDVESGGNGSTDFFSRWSSQYDLRFLVHSAQWIMAELLRSVMGAKMEEAGKLIEFVQIPLSPLVEDFGSHRLVLPDVTPSATQG